MKYHQRYSLVQRLLSNYRICYIDNEKYIIKNPSLDIIYQSHVLYEDTLHQTRFEHWLREDRCEQVLVSRKLWSRDDNTSITNVENTLENLKVELYKNSFRTEEVKRLKKSIKNLNRALEGLYIRKSVLDTYTWEEFSQFARIGFTLIHTLYDKNNKLVFGDDNNADYFFLHKVILQLHKQKLPIAEYREIARTEPWNTYWRVGKPNPFKCSVAELNEEQKTMIVYSNLYDNVSQHPEKPSELVVNHDDMLDGWLILQRIERDKELASKQIDRQLGGKHANAQEVFLPVRSLDEAKNINLMNDPQSLIIKKQRERLIEKKGQVKDVDFLDKKLDLQKQKIEAMKGNR